MKQAHYKYSPELKPRYHKDFEATDVALMNRGVTFELLEALTTRPQNPRLVSSAFATFDRILLTIPSYAFEYPAYSQVYTDLFQNLPAALNYVILVHAGKRPALDAWINSFGLTGRTAVVEAPDYMRFTVWAEDAYAAIQDQGQGRSILVEPASFNRADDGYIADTVSPATDVDTIQAGLYFQGGNILVGDDFWLIGVDYPRNSLRLGYVVPEAGETPEQAVRREYGAALDNNRTMFMVGSTLPVPQQTERQFLLNGQQWTEQLYAGNLPGTAQPMFHIDMFVTLAGRDAQGAPLVLVGDPRIADQILNRPTEQHAMVEVYDNIAANLATMGFSVVRNPLPLVYQDDPSEKKRYWYFATANNALVQVEGQQRDVWLPTYGYGDWQELRATDAANRQVWENLGFQVYMLQDFHPFAFNLGAVHCIKKYLNR